MLIINKITMEELKQCLSSEPTAPVIKVPLQFTFPPVETLSKQLTRLNSPHPHRIAYLGPRWDNSITFHKHYAGSERYAFSDRNVSKNNSYLRDSMSHNQFYKNQIYYRAFQGMNPTLDREFQVQFQSRFQSGNLDCAVKISDQQYDLFLRVDSNTRGHIFWYYFSVRNCTKGRKVRFNLCNLTKNKTHYSKGLNPFMYSSITRQWTQEGMQNVKFQQKRLRYQFLYEKLKMGVFYQLSFQVQFQGEDELRFAYCIPYTYSDLQKDLKLISSKAMITSLGKTLTGIDIPLIVVGTTQEESSKPVLIVTGRVHPGQSNSSLVLSSFIKTLCFSPQTAFLRQKVVTVIIPMLNPDGVVLGNSRCSAAGRDLNRQFKSKCKSLLPQVCALKNFVEKLSQSFEVGVYLDFHGHSRKNNMFIFGPAYNVIQPQYYKCRVIPKLFSSHMPYFRYYGSSYDIPYDKRSTARAVMLNDMEIPFFYTVETSLGFYRDYNIKKDVTFSQNMWQETGQKVAFALKEYYQGLQQYDMFLESRRQIKKSLNEDSKLTSGKATVLASNTQDKKSKKDAKKQGSKQLKQFKQIAQLKDVRILQLFKQIKEMQERKSKQEKNEKDLGDQSDSHDEKQDLPKQTMMQFTQMVTNFVNQEQKINNYEEQIQPESKSFLKDKTTQRSLKNMNKIRKMEREARMKEQEMLFSEAVYHKKQPEKRYQIKTQNKKRKITHEANPIAQSYQKYQAVAVPRKGHTRDKQSNISYHSYLQEDVQFLSVERKDAKINVRMFNFSKMVQNPRSLRYNDQREPVRIYNNQRLKSPKRNQVPFHEDEAYKKNQKQFDNKEITFHSTLQHKQMQSRSENYHKKASEQLKQTKGRSGFPSSFYRIKYHNNQRRKMDIQRNKQAEQYFQQEKTTQMNFSEYWNSAKGQSNGQGKLMSVKRCA